MKTLITPLALIAVLAAPGALSAQSASIQATASVVAQLTVNGDRGLDFGQVIAGSSETVTPGDAESGRFAIEGTGDNEISLAFDLPATLADGGETMPITFGSGSALWGDDNTGGSGTSFDPGSTANVDLPAAGALWVFIGGQVSPAAAQVPGSYSGTITLNVAYTGN